MLLIQLSNHDVKQRSHEIKLINLIIENFKWIHDKITVSRYSELGRVRRGVGL